MNIYEGVFSSYFEANKNIKSKNSFNSNLYLSTQKKIIKQTLKCLNNGKQINAFYKQHTQYLIYLISLLSNNRKLNVLDYGGGWGIGYANVLESLNSSLIKKIDYTIYDLENVCDVGKNFFSKEIVDNKNLYYIHKLKDLSNKKYDIIFLGSSLQYSEDFKETLININKMNAKYILMIDIYAGDIPSFCTLQKYYNYKMPHWFINYDEINNIFKKKYKLINKSYAHTLRLNNLGLIEMKNFKKKFRIQNSLNLLYMKKR